MAKKRSSMGNPEEELLKCNKEIAKLKEKKKEAMLKLRLQISDEMKRLQKKMEDTYENGINKETVDRVIGLIDKDKHQ